MNNTKRSLIFGVAMLLATGVFALLLSLFPTLSLSMGLYLSLYGFAPLGFFGVRQLYLRRARPAGETFFSLPAALRLRQIRAILYVLVAFMEYRRYGSFTLLAPILTILALTAVTEGYLWLTRRSLRVDFMNNAIVVNGADFRIDLPLNDGMDTVSGVYGYGDFERATLKGQRLRMEMTHKRGSLSVMLPSDRIPHIVSFLQSKRIQLDRI